MKKTAILLIAITALFSSCKKYEEDENRSLRTVKHRIAQQWDLVKVTGGYEGSIEEIQFNSRELNFEKDDSFTSIIWYTNSPAEVRTGTWEFSLDKNYIMARSDDNALVFFSLIERLEEDVLVLTRNYAGYITTYFYAPSI